MTPVLDIHGISLHYDTVGEGEPLLFLHGGLGSGDNWRFIFPEAPHGFRVIAPDQRGHGRSTNPSQALTFRQKRKSARSSRTYAALRPTPTMCASRRRSWERSPRAP